MGIFTNSIRKNLSISDKFISASIKKAVDVNKEYLAPIKSVADFSIKNHSTSTLSTTSYSRKKLKVENPSTLSTTFYNRKKLKLENPSTTKFVLNKTATPANVPFKTSSSKLTKIKPISPSTPISEQEIEHISQEMERDARRYSRRF